MPTTTHWNARHGATAAERLQARKASRLADHAHALLNHVNAVIAKGARS